jgi:hypothetical protein
VRNPGSSKGSGNEPCRCAKPTAINGMRGFFPTSAACVKCPPPQDRSPSLDLRFRVKRLAGQPAPRRRAQTLKSPPNRAFYRFSLRAEELGPVILAEIAKREAIRTFVRLRSSGSINLLLGCSLNEIEGLTIQEGHPIDGIFLGTALFKKSDFRQTICDLSRSLCCNVPEL